MLHVSGLQEGYLLIYLLRELDWKKKLVALHAVKKKKKIAVHLLYFIPDKTTFEHRNLKPSF